MEENKKFGRSGELAKHLRKNKGKWTKPMANKKSRAKVKLDVKKTHIKNNTTGMTSKDKSPSLTKEPKDSFQKKLAYLKRNKLLIHKQMEMDASDPKTSEYYNNPNNTFEEADVDII